MKAPFIIYADLELLLEKMSTCHNNTEKSSTTKINKHTPSGHSLFIQCSFYKTKNSFDYYRGKYCIKSFYLDLKKHAAIIINHKKIEEYKQKRKNFAIYVESHLVLIMIT